MNNVQLWIFQILLAIWFAFGAYKKLSAPVKKIWNREPDAFKGYPVPILILGLLEFLGAIGILASPFVYPPLTVITAICFSIVMIGATFVHIKHKRYKFMPVIILAFVLSLLVAYYRF